MEYLQHIKKPFWILSASQQIKREIDQLDPETDYQQIVMLLGGYDFYWDIARSLEVALAYTFASKSISALLYKTGAFTQEGQARYDHTKLLISYINDWVFEPEKAKRALARINKSHQHYHIPNADFKFVLWTFIEFPIVWCTHYGPRPWSAKEQRAWFLHWKDLGRQLNIQDIPNTKQELDAFVKSYEAINMRYEHTNYKLLIATIKTLQDQLPLFARPFVKTVFASILNKPQFYEAIGLKPSPLLIKYTVQTGFKAFGKIRQYVAPFPYLLSPNEMYIKSYPRGRPRLIEQMAPSALLRAETRQISHHL